MSLIYYILLTTFLGFPIIGLVLSKYTTLDKHLTFWKILIAFFAVHNVFFFLGYSLKGDYIDYVIFSIEYFFFCLIIFLLFKSAHAYVKIFRVLGAIAISLGFIIGLFGILFFIFVSLDYETDKIFHFQNNDKSYETRSYSFGGATLSDTKYTFETYRYFRYLPIEHKLDKTIFFDDKTDLNIQEPTLNITIRENENSMQIIFKSTNGNTFSKTLY